MLMLSTPAAIMTSASPTRMRSAAICTADRPEAQKRLTVIPPTVLGSPPGWRHARHVQTLLRLGNRAADDDILDAFGSSVGTCGMAAREAATSRSSGRVLRK